MSQNRGNWRGGRNRRGGGGGNRPPMDRRFNNNRSNNWMNNSNSNNRRRTYPAWNRNNDRDYMSDLGIEDFRNDPHPPPPLMSINTNETPSFDADNDR